MNANQNVCQFDWKLLKEYCIKNETVESDAVRLQTDSIVPSQINYVINSFYYSTIYVVESKRSGDNLYPHYESES